jgi:hypothetical protein
MSAIYWLARALAGLLSRRPAARIRASIRLRTATLALSIEASCEAAPAPGPAALGRP